MNKNKFAPIGEFESLTDLQKKALRGGVDPIDGTGGGDGECYPDTCRKTAINTNEATGSASTPDYGIDVDDYDDWSC